MSQNLLNLFNPLAPVYFEAENISFRMATKSVCRAGRGLQQNPSSHWREACKGLCVGHPSQMG